MKPSTETLESYGAGDEEFSRLEIERNIECGGVRITDLNQNRWRTPEELANWLVWCSAKIRKIKTHPLTKKKLRGLK